MPSPSTDRRFDADNARTRERLRALLGRLSDADLRRPLGGVWTVADALVHLAFWDLRAVTLVDRFERQGVGPSPIDVDAINDTVRELARAIPPRAAADLALRAAEAADRRVAALPDSLVAAILADDPPFNLGRDAHRVEHLDDIERALSNR